MPFLQEHSLTKMRGQQPVATAAARVAVRGLGRAPRLRRRKGGVRRCRPAQVGVVIRPAASAAGKG